MLKNQQAGLRQLMVWGLVAFALALGLDLWTKHWAWTQLRPTGETVMVWAPLLELDFVLNRGTAFSVVREVERPWVFVPITMLVLGFSLWLSLRTPGVDRLRVVALGLVSGGALGNLHDRLVRADDFGNHGVVDFIVINYPWGGSWPTFNLADSALVVGAGLLMWSLSRAPAEEPQAELEASA
jgi:signal peptidase II